MIKADEPDAEPFVDEPDPEPSANEPDAEPPADEPGAEPDPEPPAGEEPTESGKEGGGRDEGTPTAGVATVKFQLDGTGLFMACRAYKQLGLLSVDPCHWFQNSSEKFLIGVTFR